MFHFPRSAVVALAGVALALTRVPAAAEVIRVVSPPSVENAEGDLSITPDRTPIRIQYLIPASDFAGLPASHRFIASFNFRSDRTQTQSVDWTMPHEKIWLSTTNLNSLTAVFETNHGPDKTLVFDGAVTYPLLGTGPPDGPRDFADGMRLPTPFYYDPSVGNLVIELQDFDKNYPIPASVDLVTIHSDDIRTMLSVGDPSAASGFILPNIVVPFRFEMVPEPSTFALGVVCGCAALFGATRRPYKKSRSKT